MLQNICQLLLRSKPIHNCLGVDSEIFKPSFGIFAYNDAFI